MTFARWLGRLLGDVLLFGLVNKSFFLSLLIFLLLAIGLLIVGAQVSAPFIYTLF